MAKANRVHSTPRRTRSKTTAKRSAISKVKMSGLKIVKGLKAKTRGKLASAPDFAKGRGSISRLSGWASLNLASIRQRP
jgi:hypothetical protein